MCPRGPPTVARQVLRATAKLSTTVLYIPLVTVVAEVFDCSGTWSAAPWPCYRTTHLALCIIASVIVAGFSVFAFAGGSWGLRGCQGCYRGAQEVPRC